MHSKDDKSALLINKYFMLKRKRFGFPSKLKKAILSRVTIDFLQKSGKLKKKLQKSGTFQILVHFDGFLNS